MTADLHLHTNASDANLSRAQLLEAAQAKGLSCIAITDHDTMKNSYSAPDDPLPVLPACELSARDAETGSKVHLLCYLPQNSLPLREHFADMHAKRVRAGNEMLRRVAVIYPFINEQNLQQYTAFSGEIHRQDILNVLRAFGYTDAMFGDLYRKLFGGKDAPGYVPVEYRTAQQVLDTARASRGVVVLAHPSVYNSMALARRWAEQGLIDGLEVHHPRNTGADKAELAALCVQHNLVATGGSDYHGANSHGGVLPGDGVTDRYNLDLLREKAANK